MNDLHPDIFISYSSKDYAWVEQLAKALKACGYKVWWDRDLQVGDNYHKTIGTALNNARCVVTVWSENSVESKWVLSESERADKRGVYLPLIYKLTTLPLAFCAQQNADFRAWQGNVDEMCFKQLLSAIVRVTQKPAEEVVHIVDKPDVRQDMIKRPFGVYRLLGIVVLCVLVIGFLLLKGNGQGNSGIKVGGDITFGDEATVSTGSGNIYKNDSQ